LREGLRAGPIAAFAGFVGLGQEAADFFDEIVLRGTQALAGCLLQVSLGDAGVFVGLVFQAGLIPWRKLRRNLRRGSACGLLGLSVPGGFAGLAARRRWGFGMRRLHG